MRNNKGLYLIRTVLVGVILLMTAGPSMALKIGDKAPDFDLPSSTGQSIKLADYLGEKPVVLFFYIGAFTNT